MNGKLKILSDRKNVIGSTIELNGQPFPVKNITITGNVQDNVWEVRAEFFSDGLDIDIEGNVKKMEVPDKESEVTV